MMSRSPTGSSTQLHLERELLTIAASKRSKTPPSAFATRLLNSSENAPFQEVINYFFEGNPSEQQARQIWSNLLSYRRTMTQSFGDRVSLHIAVYHLSRDPHYIKEHGLDPEIKPKEQAKQVAILELKAWWERCSETGTHLRSIIEQQLDRLVHLGSRDHQPVSFGLLRIIPQKKVGQLTEGRRSQISRWLMDSCRCQDLIAHYENNSFAMVFPYTNRSGAISALKRLLRTLPSQLEEKENFGMSLASFPENGTRGRELTLMASFTLDKAQADMSKKGCLKLCEGKRSPAYLWWTFTFHRPLLHFFRSPKHISIAIAILIFATFGVHHLKLNRPNPWVLQHQQVLDDHQSFPLWQWGRKQGQGFKLKSEDGFALNSGELVCDSNELWFKLPLKIKGELKIVLFFKRSLGSSLVFHLGDQAHEKSISLEITPEAIFFKQNGATLASVPHSLAASTKHRLEMTLGKEGLNIETNGQLLVEHGSWSAPPSWPKSLYFSTSNGSTLLWDLRVYDRGSPLAKDANQTPLKTLPKNSKKHHDLKISPYMNQLLEASLSTSPLKACRQQLETIPNPSEQAQFLKGLFAIDWGSSQGKISQWAWGPITEIFDKLHEEQQLHFGLLFIKKPDIESSPELDKICAKLLHLAHKAPLLIYQTIESCPIVLERLTSWPNNRKNPVLSLLQARASEDMEQRRALLQQLQPWVQQTDFGKLMRYEWMWLQIKDHRMIQKQQISLAEQLRRQSRRPDIARRVQGLIYPATSQQP
jgi:GGDEF domain-containing protein